MTEKQILDRINNEEGKRNIILKILSYVIIALIFLFIGKSFSQDYLISDYEFTNQKYSIQSVYKFVKSFDNNLNYSDVEFVVRYCHIYKINPLIVFTKMQMESDLLERNCTNLSSKWLRHRAMGYGMKYNFKRDGKKFYKYGGYEIQIYFAIKTLREKFDEYQLGLKKEILDLNKKIEIKNAATWSLYRYTPFYESHNIYEWKNKIGGNKTLIKLYNRLKIIYNEYIEKRN